MPSGSLNNSPSRPFLARAILWSPGAGHYIFAAVLAVRLVALTRLTASPFLLPSQGDMYFYNDWALRILQGQFTDHQAFYGLPGYAYLLALLYKIFGYSPFVPGLLQAALEAGTATLLYKMAIRIFKEGGQAIGCLAALGWAFFIPAQAYSVILMPTAWMVFVFWFVIWKVVGEETAPGSKQSLWLGLLVGVTATAVATVLFLVPLLLAAILLRQVRRAKVIAAALLFVGLAVGTSPCWLHNLFVAHDRVFLSAHAGINFWIGNNPNANGYPRIPPGLRAGQSAMLQDSIVVAESAVGHPLPRSDVAAYWGGEARAYIRENFSDWLGLLVLKVRNFWNAFQYDDLSIITNLREQGTILPGLRFGLIAALAIPGIFLTWLTLPRSRWVILAILLQMASLLPVFVTERYRLACVPGLLLFAAFALHRLFDFVVRAKLAQACYLCGGLAASTYLVAAPQRDPGLWALDAYNSGWQALEAGNLTLAQQKLDLAYAYVPKNAEINFALGNLGMARKDFARADIYFRNTLALEARHKSALTNLGVSALEQSQPERAVSLFREALMIAPADAKGHYLLARALLEKKELTEALSEIEFALKLKFDQPEFKTLHQRINEGLLKAPPGKTQLTEEF